MKQKHRQKPAIHRRIAEESIQRLFEEAEKVPSEELDLADRYVAMARKIAMKYKVRIPAEYKRRFCKHCYSYLKQEKTCRIRLNKGKKVYYCLKCRKFMRIPYSKKQ